MDGIPRTIPLEVLHLATQAAWLTSTRDGMIFETLIDTAIRNQELRLLLVGDVYRAGNIVLSLRIRPEIAKYSKGRNIPLTSSFQKKLHLYVIKNCWNGSGPDLAAPLYPSQKTKGHLTRKALCEIVKKHLAKCGFSGYPHMIRHTAATELLRVSNARVVQLILGHQRLDTVQIYTHPTDQDLRQALEGLHRGERGRPPELDPALEEDVRPLKPNVGRDREGQPGPAGSPPAGFYRPDHPNWLSPQKTSPRGLSVSTQKPRRDV